MLVELLIASSIWVFPPPASDDLHIPDRFMGDKTVTVVFTDQAGVDKTCGKSPEGLITLGCVDKIGSGKKITVTNPCLDKDAETPDTYAHLMCHEIAHLNGWTHDVQ